LSAYFFDSSALVKRYVSEIGTTWVASVIDAPANNHIHVARITGVEVTSAITRRTRSSSLSRVDATAALSLFRYEFSNNFTVTEISPGLVTRAMQLAETYALRGYDAVQLAAALDVQSYLSSLTKSGLTMISADVELNTAAAAEGLITEDPNAHP
jgi:predicted nucleic acid-binding protein